jgi:hypothetical protein
VSEDDTFTIEHEAMVGECVVLSECSRLLGLPLDRTAMVLDRTTVHRIQGFDRAEVERLRARLDAQPDLRRLLLR